MNSVVSYPDRGEGGRSSYRGNCSPRFVEDIIHQYKIRSMSDYMVGSGTTEDVCKRLGVTGTYLNLNRGWDMMSMEIPDRPENIFWHPPYGGMIVYSDEQYSAKDVINKYGFDPREHDLSRAKNWDEFVVMLNHCILKQFASLEKGGRLFCLMGDWKQKGKLYSMLCDIVKPGTLEQIIIKMQHNCVSDRRTYSNSNFVPIVHEYCMVVRKDAPLLIEVSFPKKLSFDVRDREHITWRDVVAAILEEAGRPMTLDQIYSQVDGHKKTEQNRDWKAKVRQTLQLWPGFQHNGPGVWSLSKTA